MRWKFVGLASIIAVLAPAAGLTAEAVTPPLPSSMAAIGDSITQAFDVCCWYGEHPSKSWSTGNDGTDVILSHFERIKAVNPAMAGHGSNDSVTGANMADAPGQAAAAVAQQASYVTILMGANDVCTSSPATMTSTDVFRSQFDATLQTLEAGLPPDAHIFVSSIPNVFQLWKTLHNSGWAQSVWFAAQICQSMLSPFNTRSDRRAVLDRERAFNDILAQECAAYANCRFDGYATFNYSFTAQQVSTLDFFHPSISGQKILAQITWQASWWPSV
ncbi:MAG TPA: SGNH/GDSL hydrolase family protein [Actinomycetota bacterium]|nr:SGNH/GDSL hydrolase family protein [Actinomycetota bacterium]